MEFQLKYTGDPRLMQILLLQFFKTFQIYLGNAFFGPKYFITAIFMIYEISTDLFTDLKPKPQIPSGLKSTLPTR